MYSKTNRPRKKQNMSLALSKKSKTYVHAPAKPPQSVAFFPLSSPKAPEEICLRINKNLFQLEKNVAFFHFALTEIKDLS